MGWGNGFISEISFVSLKEMILNGCEGSGSLVGLWVEI